MSFSPLVMQWNGGEKYTLTESLIYQHKDGPIIVPAGFESDLDSVPRLPFAYWLFKGRSRRPAVVHDYLYSIQVNRAWADRVFLDAMADIGVPRRQRWPIYWAVRTGGWVAYRSHAKAS